MSDYLQFRQKLELRKLLAPQMRHSLHILALPLLDLVQEVNEEMLTNPVLEEEILEKNDEKTDFKKADSEIKAESLEKLVDSLSPTESNYDDRQTYESNVDDDALDQKKDFKLSLITKKVTLQDHLLQQLSIYCDCDEELAIGQELIGNIDDNGYLRLNLDEICHTFKVTLEEVERILKIIQKFEPFGVGARNIPECLLIQLEISNQKDDLIENIVKLHLEDIANKNYTKIAKALKQPIEVIEEYVKKISKLNPKPGRNYSTEEPHQIIPDIIIEEYSEDNEDKKVKKNKIEPSQETDESSDLTPKPLRIIINNENIPRLVISNYYKNMIKKGNLDQEAKDYITNKLKRAYELLQAVTKRQSTLRMVVETILSIQEQAIRQDLSYLKPLTFRQVAEIIKMHESTVCRVVMNKYVYAPCGVVALKDFFPSKINSKDDSGQSLSSEYARSLIKDIIETEDKKHPLSDEEIVKSLKEKHNLDLARRTVAKYREEMRILSSSRRKIR